MAEVKEFKLPDLGEGLTEAEVVRWLVEVGEAVAVDQPVVEVETAKAMVEVPCPYGGVVTARYGEEGEELAVGAPLLTVAVGAGTPAPGRGSGSPGPGSGDLAGVVAEAAGADVEAAEAGGAGETSGAVLVGYGTGAPPVRRRRVRPASHTPGGAVDGPAPAAAAGPVGGVPSGYGRHAVTPDAAVRQNGSAPAAGPVPVISPLVRRLARQNGVELRTLTGSGPDGLILRADVERAIGAAAAPAEQPAAASAADGEVRIALRGLRGVVADKMSRSRREIPEATCWVDADATELLAARRAMNAAGGPDAPKISLLAVLARICTAALARFPELNARVDTEAREIVRLERLHLGFAAQTDRGLVVPVVRDAHTRGAESLSEELARLTGSARAGTLTPGELTGSTFTLNNYGVFGVDGSTPIINHPEAAMLGVGRIVPKPWVHEGELAVRHVTQLSLTFDHRVCDGGVAGGFLRYVADCVEQPAVLLRGI
ncbi:dihydrolipoamide acetyltransferase family protein [Streptomyces diastaticus]|uniref:Dihydrolipoamide acetyltransferase component of pyruvate dehydrogenase complex n=1 Tax=Streptomyces rutgersensis TaxID=53451 RepID=A0ABX6RNT9_9ACTN|nr:dihydrolipoamide acetyltransferase family protein [Streptomyces rutgersensis]QNE82076.1 2-oxo acid dehydrogenase subunit E2 [Streptomyces rutgersensis]